MDKGWVFGGVSLKSSKNIITSQQQRERKLILPDLFRDFQKIRGEETGENPTKAPSTFFISLSWFWFSIEAQQEREKEVEEQEKSSNNSTTLISRTSSVFSCILVWLLFPTQTTREEDKIVTGYGDHAGFGRLRFGAFGWKIYMSTVVSSLSTWVPYIPPPVCVFFWRCLDRLQYNFR
jgi:hypothetical protein